MNATAPKPTRPRGRPPKAASPAAADACAAAPAQDQDHATADILEAATAEFAHKGLAGARVDEIAALTRTSKRMIYYYFGSKEGLYVRVLEDAYARIRRVESGLHLEDLEPEPALRRLVAFTFDYHLAHPDFVRLVMNENIHHGQFLARSPTIQQLNQPAIETLARLYRRGVAAGVFRPDVDPVDLHLSISALCFYNVSNRHTFSLIFRRDVDSPEAIAARRDSVVETIVRSARP